MDYLLGIDGGTECIKAAIYDLEGNLIALSDYKYDTFYIKPGWAEQKIEHWRKGLIESVRQVIALSKIDPAQISGISADATCCSIVFIDRDNNPVRDPIIWMDVRAVDEAEYIDSIEDSAKKYNGFSKVSPEWFPCKLLWMKKNEPENLKKAAVIAEYTDWLTHELTDLWTLGISTVTVRGYYDNRHGGWPLNFYKKIGLSEIFEKLPVKVLRVGQLAGGISDEFARLTGLKAGTPVAQGGFDAIAGMIGSNAFNNGQVFLIAGSSNYIQVNIDKEFNAKGIFGSYPDTAIDNFAIEGGQVSTGSVMKWFKNNFINNTLLENANKEGLDIYKYMDSEAKKIPIGSEGIIFVEHLQGNRTPFIDPKSRGIIAGLSLKHTPVHIYRSIMEAVAFGTECTLRVLKKNNFKLTEIIACGGQFKSELWAQIYADVTGIPIKLTTNPEATTLGSAILGGMAAKKFNNLNEAADKMVKYKETILPNKENHEKYKYLLDRYVETYESLRENIYKISDFNNMK